MKYFYDTSAIHLYLVDDSRVVAYFESPSEGVVLLPNIMEAYFTLLRKVGEHVAEKALDLLYPITATPRKIIIQKAMKFRLKYEKLGLSYADALGYTYAKEHDMQFLTCDTAFKGLPGVIFIS